MGSSTSNMLPRRSLKKLPIIASHYMTAIDDCIMAIHSFIHSFIHSPWAHIESVMPSIDMVSRTCRHLSAGALRAALSGMTAVLTLVTAVLTLVTAVLTLVE